MEVLLWICLILLISVLGLLFWVLRRSASNMGVDVEGAVRDELRQTRQESTEAGRKLREELSRAQKSGTELVVTTIGEMGKTQKEALDSTASEIKQLTASNETRLDKLRETVDDKLKQMQTSNEAKLEEMRKTVDEKLHNTLEKRLGESFKLVSQQLEAVQSGLGEMRRLGLLRLLIRRGLSA